MSLGKVKCNNVKSVLSIVRFQEMLKITDFFQKIKYASTWEFTFRLVKFYYSIKASLNVAYIS